MSLRINTNLAALNAHRQLTETDERLRVTMERLSSGYRINRSQDDVAGLSIANKFRMEVRALRAAQQNVAQGQSLLQVAEGGTNKIETIVERLKELAISASSSNVDSDGRSRINAEAQALMSEIDQIANDTKYSGNTLLAGAINLTFQVGSGNVAAEDRITVTTSSGLLTSNLGLGSLSLNSIASAQSALTSLDSALVSVNLVVGEIGAAASRLEFSAGNLAISIENLDASHSTIRDADMAYEMTNLTRDQILLQAGTSMLAQANLMPQSVLALLGK
ncbi:MAG: flagellin [Deltaproteobacteria bacterium]|nr:flagellin [Deltaproteobacteria bacterium]